MVFPDPRKARADGLTAVGGSLSADLLLRAYASGLFPWTVHPVTWWSPDPRGILELDDIHVPRSLARSLRRGDFEVTFNRDFGAVIHACATAPRRDQRTWITPEFVVAYTELHRRGHAHSVEVWAGGDLVGGLYGVTVGGLFSGESMFHRRDDASKVALVRLAGRLKELGFVLFDTQMVTPVTRRLGAVEVARDDYLARLEQAVKVRPAPL